MVCSMSVLIHIIQCSARLNTWPVVCQHTVGSYQPGSLRTYMHCLESDVACGVCLCLCRPSWSSKNANDSKLAKTVLGAGTNLRPYDVSIWLRRPDTQTEIHWWQMATMFNIKILLSQQSLHQMVNWLCARRDWEQRRGETSEERWLGGQKVAVGAIWLLDGPMCTHTWFYSGWWVLWGPFLTKIDKVEGLDQRRSL